MSASDITRVRRYFERGTYFLNQNQLADACVNFRDALQLAPFFLPARTHLALALSKQKKYLEAIRLLEEGRKNFALRNDELVELYSLLGNICLIRQDYPASIFYYKAASKLDPHNSMIRANLAQAMCKAGQLDEGLDLLLLNAREA